MKRIAVIGSGISGLAAAYYLSRRHQVFLFERDTRIGGHTHTIVVDSSRGPLPVDTGFIVHNDRTYPNFCRLMSELGIATQPSDMSFAVTSRVTDFEYSSRGLAGFFACKRNLLSPAHYRLLADILRFNREAPAVLNQPNADETTLGAFLETQRYSRVFIDRYLVPMAGSVWSMSPDAMPDFPLLTLVRFMHNHGMLGINTHPKWKTIRGGSHAYLPPLTAPFRDRITTGVEIKAVTRHDQGVTLSFTTLPDATFDEVVFACHGDQILPLLANPTDTERSVLTSFTTSSNEACLHTDQAMLPRRPAARAAWNYLLGDSGNVTLTYHMNRLQSLDTPEQYSVTLNATRDIQPSAVLRTITYEHPLYNRPAIRAQQRWPEISGRNRTHFCGAYWFYGFHEDGVRSAMRVAEALGVSCQ